MFSSKSIIILLCIWSSIIHMELIFCVVKVGIKIHFLNVYLVSSFLRVAITKYQKRSGLKQ